MRGSARSSWIASGEWATWRTANYRGHVTGCRERAILEQELPAWAIMKEAPVPAPSYRRLKAAGNHPDSRHIDRKLIRVAGDRRGPPSATCLAQSWNRFGWALASLRHGPWWPSLDDLIGAARRFYPDRPAEGTRP